MWWPKELAPAGRRLSRPAYADQPLLGRRQLRGAQIDVTPTAWRCLRLHMSLVVSIDFRIQQICAIRKFS
jgi:hypothetical protein